MNHQ